MLILPILGPRNCRFRAIIDELAEIRLDFMNLNFMKLHEPEDTYQLGKLPQLCSVIFHRFNKKNT